MIFTSSSHSTPQERAHVTRHNSMTLWFTGLSASGKSTLTNRIEKELIRRNVLAFRLDGDNLRTGLCQDLGFSMEDRDENIRRAGELCCLLNQAGLVVLAGFISPSETIRQQVRQKHQDLNLTFQEIYLNPPIETCIQRDPKGLYQKALHGDILDFTGISSKYDIPEHPEHTFDTSRCSVDEIVDQLVSYILHYVKYPKR